MSALEEDAEPKASSEVCEDTTTDAPEVEEIKEKVGEASNDEVSCTPDGKAETNESVENATPVEVVGIAGPQQTEKEGEGGRDQSILNLKELPRTGKRGAPQAFPHLLFLMLEREPKEVIQWTEEGRAFMITDLSAFIATTLVKYFRHSRYASFQRQLNLYGFRKNESGAFEHKFFIREMPDLLTRVQRSPQPSKASTRTSKKSMEAEHHAMSMQRKYEHPTLKNVSSARKPTAATSTKRTAAMMYDQQQLLHRGVVPSSDGYMILNDRGDSDMGGDHHMSNKRNRYMQPQQQETLWRMVEPGRYEPVVRGGPIGHKMPMQYMPNGSVGPGLNAGMASQYDYYNVVADGEQDMMQNGYMMVPQQKHHPDLVGRAGIMPKNTSGVLKRSTKTIQRVTERPPNMSDAEWAVHQYANESDNAADEDYRQVRQDESTGPFQSGMRMMVPWAQPGSGASRKFPDGRVERTNSMPNLGSGGYGQGIPGRNNFGGPLPTRQWGNNGNEDIQGWGQPQQGVDRPYSLVVASGTPARGNNEPSKAQQGAKKRNEKVGPIALNEEEGSEGHQNAGYSDDASPRQQEYMPSGLTPTNGALAGFSPSSSNETFFNNPISPSSSALYGSALNFDEEGRGTGGNIFSFSPHRGGAMRASSQQQQMAYQQQQQQIYYPSSRGPFQYPTNRAQQQGGGGTRTGAKGRRGPYKRDDSETMAAAAAEEAHNKSTSEMMMTHAAGRGVGGGEGGSHVTFAPGVAQSPASAAYHRQRSFNRNASEDEAILLRRTISLSSDDWNRGLDETAEVVNTLASFGRTNSVVQGDQYDRQGQPSSAPYDDRDQEMDELFEGHHSSLEPHPQHPTFSYGQAETA